MHQMGAFQGASRPYLSHRLLYIGYMHAAIVIGNAMSRHRSHLFRRILDCLIHTAGYWTLFTDLWRRNSSTSSQSIPYTNTLRSH